MREPVAPQTPNSQTPSSQVPRFQASLSRASRTGGTRRPGTTTRVRVDEVRASAPARSSRGDVVATEEPLEIRVSWPGSLPRSLVVTMRTPGADFELAAGFLYGEGIVSQADDIARIAYCTDPELTPEQLYNVVTVELSAPPGHEPAQRYGAATSACGVCGKQRLDDLELRGYAVVESDVSVRAELAHGLPDGLRDAQNVFDRTGGLHATGLFNPAGQPLVVREDVGRHNAFDKVVGWALLNQAMPLAHTIVAVSGRVGFEIAQKALAAAAPVMVAVGAPSSLAVDLCDRFGITLVGFARDQRFVIYTHPHRIEG